MKEPISDLESAALSILFSLSAPKNRRKAMLVLFTESERRELLERCRLQFVEIDKRDLKASGEIGLEPRSTPPLEAVTKELIVVAYADQRHISLRQAILDIARRLEFIGETDYQLLSYDLNIEENRNPVPSEKPEFRKDGTLLFRGEMVARFRMTKTKSRLVKALEMLQLNGWAPEVENRVFRKSKSLPDIADRLRSHTKGKLHFSGSEASNTLSWRPI